MATLNGTACADLLEGGSQPDTLRGLGGDDRLFGYLSDDLLYGDSGDDRLFGGDGTDEMFGGTGDDSLDGGLGDDTLFGGRGADALRGGDGVDNLSGTTDTGRNDFVSDRVQGGAGGDFLNGADASSDVLLGEGGDDGISAANDTAFGGDGNDRLNVLFAEAELEGGAGADTFRFRTAEGDNESSIVTDFRTGQDKLSLDHTSPTAQVRLEGVALFERLDADGSGTLTAADGVGTGPDGLFAGVQRAEGGPGITIVTGEDQVTLEGAASVALADWL